MTHIWCMTLPQWIQKRTGNRLAVRSVRVDAWETEAALQGPAICLSDRLLEVCRHDSLLAEAFSPFTGSVKLDSDFAREARALYEERQQYGVKEKELERESTAIRQRVRKRLELAEKGQVDH